MVYKRKQLPPLPFDPPTPQVTALPPPPPPPPLSTERLVLEEQTTRKVSSSFIDDLERKQRQRLIERVKFATAIISALMAGGGAVYGVLEGRVQSAIEDKVGPIETQLKSASELATGIHEKHRTTLEPTIENQGQRLTKLEKETFELYRFLVGEKASNLERDRRKRARARDIAYRKFEYYVERGETLDDAYRKATGAQLP